MRKLILLAALGLMASAAMLMLAFGDNALQSQASSHRDAPLISEDPTADNTDLYAFVSPESGRSDHVTLIANYIPLEEPGDGPNYFRFSDDVVYEIMVDTNGDAREDVTYQFKFNTNVAALSRNTFLYNTGQIGMPPNPSDPSSQYANLNQQQSYTVAEIRGDRRKGGGTVLLQGARVAPINIGPRSVGTQAQYEALADAAVHTVGTNPSDIRVFAGPRDEGFYVDLMGAFDLLNVRNPGVDTTSGFNVHTIAIELPKSRLQAMGDTDGVVGVWASASRPGTTILRSGMVSATGNLQQVSRLGNPLVNEVLIPLAAKDKFNASEPHDDGDSFAPYIINPGATQGGAALIPLLNGLTNCTPVNGRSDLELALLKGIPGGVVPGFPGNRDTQRRRGPVSGDMLHLNYNIAPAASPNRLGLLGGDIAGFPNGRRVGDDVTDIDLKAAAGAVLHVLGAINCPASLTLGDNVDANDVPYLTHFPYLGTPHQGYDHVHDHSGMAGAGITAVSMGMGAIGLLLGLSLLIPKVLPFARRRIR
jgi:hypothetical protein